MISRCRCLLYVIIVIIGLVRYVYALPDFCTTKTEYNEPTSDYCEETEQPHLGCNNKNVSLRCTGIYY